MTTTPSVLAKTLAALIIGPAATLTLVAGLLCLRSAWQGVRSLDPPQSPA